MILKFKKYPALLHTILLKPLKSFSKKMIKQIFIITLCLILALPAGSYGAVAGSLSDSNRLLLPLDFTPADILADPEQPVVYLTNTAEQQVVALNYQTQEISTLTSDGYPKKMDWKDGDLYVTVSKTMNERWSRPVLNGSIAIIDTLQFQLKDILSVDNDPADVVVDHDGYIHVFPSGETGDLVSYSPVIKQKTGTYKQYHSTGEAYLDPVRNIIYDTFSYNSIEYFQIESGAVKSYAYPHDHEYQYNTVTGNYSMSPDGQYHFNSSGYIFDSSFGYVTRLNNDYTNVAFDLNHNRFFTAEDNKMVVAYDYNNGLANEQTPFRAAGSFYTAGNPQELFFSNDLLIVLSTLDSNQYFLEIYAIPTSSLPKTQPNYVPPTPVVPVLQKGDNTFQAAVPLDFTPSDSLLDPEKPVLYLADSVEKNVYAFNYLTQELKKIALDAKPVSLVYSQGELVVALSRATQPSYAWQPGYLNFVATDSFTLKDQMEIAIDPQAAFVDREGYIYVFAAPVTAYAGQRITYSRASKQLIEKLPYGYNINYARQNPVSGNIITTQNTNPIDLNVYETGQGKITNYFDSPYHGHYDLSNHFRISPDGKYVFNASGDVFDGALRHVSKLNNKFSDIAFDLDHGRFFTGEENRKVVINSYNNNNLSRRFYPQNTFYTKGNIQKLYYQDETLVSLSTMGPNQYFIEIYSVPAGYYPVTDPLAIPTDTAVHPVLKPVPNPELQTFPLAFSPLDSVIDPNRPLIYLTSSDSKKVYAVNYRTGETSEITFQLKPERLALHGDRLYVTLTYGHQSYSDKALDGYIGVIDTGDFSLVDQIYVETDPYDVIVDHQGYIYVTPASQGVSQKIFSYNPVTKQRVKISEWMEADALMSGEIHPTENIFYTSYAHLSGHAIRTFNAYEGKFAQMASNSVEMYQVPVHFRLSPDGKYIFYASGDVLNRAVKPITKIPRFTDIAFDLESGRFFAGHNGSTVTVYDYNNQNLTRSFYSLGNFKTIGEVSKLYYQDQSLVVLSRKDRVNLLEVYTIPAGSIPLTGKYIPSLEDGELPENYELPFQVNSVFPVDQSENTPVNVPVVIQFNHPIQEGAYFKEIALTDQTGAKVNASVYVSGNILLVLPEQDLKFSTAYSIRIPHNAVTDLNGAALEELVFGFTTGSEYNRLGGSDRIETSIKIAQEGWKTADYVMLATSQDFPDALAASPLASKYNAPILLTTPQKLPFNVEKEIKRLNPQVVFLIGGENAVSDSIKQKLESQGILAVRLSGTDRYDTSLVIAQSLNPSAEAFIVTGGNFPDALSIASYAATKEIPIILSRPDSLAEEAVDYLEQTKVQKTYLIGGKKVLSEDIAGQIPQAARISGSDRYDTNLKVLARFNYDFTYTFFATGRNFPDALAGSALAAAYEAPIVLVSDSQPNDLSYYRQDAKMKYILGAEGVLPMEKVVASVNND